MASCKTSSSPTGALEVLCNDGNLETSGGVVLLRSLSSQASARADTVDCLSQIVGFQTQAGPDSTLDCALAQLECQRFLALSRTSLWWMTPAWGTSSEHIPTETQFLLALLPDGRTYGLLLPLICSSTFRGTLRPAWGGCGGGITLRMESGDPAIMTHSISSGLLVSAGTDPFQLIQRGVTAAARLSGTAQHRSCKQVPAAAEVFGYCTWDAFYSRVSAAGIQHGLRSLGAGGTPPRLLIIDDGWQQTDVDVESGGDSASAAVPAETSLAAGKAGLGDAAAVVLGAAAHPESLGPAGVRGVEHDQHSGGAAQGTPARSTPLLRPLWWCMSVLEYAAMLCCIALLRHLPSRAWPMRLFSHLAAGRLRGALRRFYAKASDHTRRLLSVEANSKFASPEAGEGSPLSSSGGDLRVVVKHLKQQYGLQYVYAWHAIMGFWGGVSQTHAPMQKYHPQLIMPEPSKSILEVDPTVAWQQPVVAGMSVPLDPAPLHQDMHAYLAGCGVDGVKVDVQSTVGLLGSRAGGGPALSAAYHASLEQSARAHFPGNHLINCMCHSTEDLYRLEHTNLARVSDDFYPRLPPSHSAHVTNCAFNSLFMGELVVPDWDMFHSKHPKGLLHATARAVSGGPVYVSDKPGHHDFGLLRRLVLPDGTVLRCHLPGRPTADCLLRDVSSDGCTALKVWNANACTCVVGVFNLQGAAFSRAQRRFRTHDPTPPPLTALVSPSDVPPLRGGARRFAAYLDSTQGVTLLREEESMEVAVEGGGGCDVVTLSPVLEAGGVSLAPIGLVDMLNAGGAVLSCTLSGQTRKETTVASGELWPVGPSACVVDLRVRGRGSFLCYTSSRPCTVVAMGSKEGAAQVAFHYSAEQCSLFFEVAPGDSTSRAYQIKF